MEVRKYDSVKGKSSKNFLYEVQIHYCYQVQSWFSKIGFTNKINASGNIQFEHLFIESRKLTEGVRWSFTVVAVRVPRAALPEWASGLLRGAWWRGDTRVTGNQGMHMYLMLTGELKMNVDSKTIQEKLVQTKKCMLHSHRLLFWES